MGQAMWTDSGITRHLPLPNSTIGAAPLVTFLFTMAFMVLFCKARSYGLSAHWGWGLCDIPTLGVHHRAQFSQTIVFQVSESVIRSNI